jgi:hypothetical protein
MVTVNFCESINQPSSIEQIVEREISTGYITEKTKIQAIEDLNENSKLIFITHFSLFFVSSIK